MAMSLPADSIPMNYAFLDYNGDHMNLTANAMMGSHIYGTSCINKLKRPRSPKGIVESSRCISEEELSEVGSESEKCTSFSSSFSERTRSAEDFSILLGDAHSSVTTSSFDVPFDDFAGDRYLSYGQHGVSPNEESLSAKRRKKLSILVPYPRVPRTAEYQCSNCSHSYCRTVADNPWWAVYRHDCPSCHTNQVPRIDITKDENAIESDPNVLALYGEGVDDSADEGDDEEEPDDTADEDSDREVTADETDSAAASTCFDCEGNFGQDDAAKLLVLMCHAKSCAGNHSSAKHAEICKSTKCMMMHVRDCKGTTSCEFAWCGTSKLLLQHVASCTLPYQCRICTPRSLPDSLQQLHILNQFNSSR